MPLALLKNKLYIMANETLIGFSSKVKPEVKAHIYKTAETLGLTIGDALSYIIAQADKPAPEPVTIKEKVFEDATINRMTALVAAFVTDAETQTENDLLIALINRYNDLIEQVGLLTAREPETITKEVEKLVPIALEPTQFICDLPADITANMRKVRPFMKKAGVLTTETANPTEMVTVALKYYLNNKWEHVLNPAFR